MDQSSGRTIKDLPEPATHRRILAFINDAIRPEDLANAKGQILGEGAAHEDGAAQRAPKSPKRLVDPSTARKLLEFRDREYPLRFRHLREIIDAGILDSDVLERIRHYFSSRYYGSWAVFPQPIPRRGPGAYNGVVHAAMLPLFRKRVRGRGFMRAGDAFYCDQHDVLARGRGKRTKYLA
jgi:hypothetical protein